MIPEVVSPYLQLLKNQIDLVNSPFSERGSRLLVMREGASMSIRLAERWVKLDQRVSGYRERPPIIQDFHLTDGEGRRLEFQMDTYPHRLDYHTPIGEFSLTFVDMESLLLILPEAACGIVFRAHMNTGQPDRRGGILRVIGDIRRNMAYTTNRPIIENRMTQTPDGGLEVHLRLGPGPVVGLLMNLTPRLGFNRYIPPAVETLDAAERRWDEWFAAVPPVLEPYRMQYYFAWWVMRAGIISTRFYTTREAMTPSKIYYIGVWQWDAYFHALAYRHISAKLAHDQIRVVLDHQLPSGMIPDAVHDEGTITHLTFPIEADVTKPPLLAWSAWKLFETDHDREFLDEIYEPIVKWNEWWFQLNDVDGDGLCEYRHPYSSGLDDSPLWDGGMPVTSPDLNTYLYLQMENLARIAQVLGLDADAQMWGERTKVLLDRMNQRLWDPQEGLYWAYRSDGPVRIRTPFSLFPLLTGRLDPVRAQRLVDHLLDPKEFWLQNPVPTVARSEPSYDPWVMWRGPTWLNVNYLVHEGLERSGFTDVANQLRERTLNMIIARPGIYEYYNPETGQPGPHAAAVFGWSAALFIEMAIDFSRKVEAGQAETKLSDV